MAWEAARTRQPGALWIWKPCSQSCGRGIRVLGASTPQEELRQLATKRGVIQKYVDKPLLLDGYKFDLRIYVVVLSYDPLKVYINDEGLVRLATEKYSPSVDTLESRTMHLTNYSVNKSSPVFVQNKDGRNDVVKLKNGQELGGETCPPEAQPNGEEPRAFKWSLHELRKHLEASGLDYDAMYGRIKDVVIKTLLAAESPLQTEWSKSLEQEEEGWAARGPAGCHRGSCFEIYGFDVIVDSAMKPWLLEVNICPSLSSGSPLDKRIKTKLVADTLTLAGIRPPPSFWQPGPSVGTKRKVEGVTSESCADVKDLTPVACTWSKADLDKRTRKLLECKTAKEAVAMFEQAEWELVLDSHDEDMRRGGLERIFPTAGAAQYLDFVEESYCNLVLRRWHEAGGAQLLKPGAAPGVVPAWLPRQVSFSRT
uniref:Tubulin--tyrosine ligase-like protein 5 n=2 Tax=Zooxanthella nutricula TaxID=1333877 RepID=A0A7S2J0F0_9DINO